MQAVPRCLFGVAEIEAKTFQENVVPSKPMQKDGVKFACLCLRAVIAGELLDARAELPGDYWLEPPWEEFDVNVWKNHIGTWRIDEIARARLWIWVVAPSARLDVNDAEHDQLEHRLFLLWQGLQLHRPGIVHSAWVLMGNLKNAKPDVQSLKQYRDLFVKEPDRELTLSGLRHAAATALDLQRLYDSGVLAGRLDRGLAAFFGAMHNEHLDESILSLVRAVEGILHPKDADQFVKRSGSVVKIDGGLPDALTTLLRELYDVRSGFTHAEALATVFQGNSHEEGKHRAQQLQAFAYLLASGAYTAVLRQDTLTKRFSTEGQGEYWGKITAGKKKPPFTVQLDEQDWSFGPGAFHDD